MEETVFEGQYVIGDVREEPKMTDKKNVVEMEGVGKVYCYMCTHVVEVPVSKVGNKLWTKPGQVCPRCKASIDAGAVLELRAA